MQIQITLFEIKIMSKFKIQFLYQDARFKHMLKNSFHLTFTQHIDIYDC